MLAYTYLSGSIPEELYLGLQGMGGPLYTGVVELRLNNCNFSGTLSTNLGLLTTLRRLTLSNNALYGEIPEEMSKLTQLNEFWLHGNQLTGTISGGICEIQASHNIGPQFELMADCTPDRLTGIPPVSCPEHCCTACCDVLTGICQDS